MSTNLPTKPSSRAGRFKKKLVPEAFLEKEAPVIEEQMTSLLEQYKSASLSAAEFSGLYILTVLAYRYPGAWLGAKSPQMVTSTHNLIFDLTEFKTRCEPNIQRRLESFTNLGDVFQNFAFKSTPQTVNRSILNWSLGNYGLELMFRIPRPAEVLDQQKRGRRCVTIVLEREKASKFILGERDALGFTMHDLIHADHFYHNNHSFQGQLGFYGFLDHCLNQHHFDELLLNPEFEAEFEYLIADMNAYPTHLLKCFKAALVHYHQKGTIFFEEWCEKLKLSQDEKKSFLNLNQQVLSEEDDRCLMNYLSKWKSA